MTIKLNRPKPRELPRFKLRAPDAYMQCAIEVYGRNRTPHEVSAAIVGVQRMLPDFVHPAGYDDPFVQAAAFYELCRRLSDPREVGLGSVFFCLVCPYQKGDDEL